jgi:hypothetical protein
VSKKQPQQPVPVPVVIPPEDLISIEEMRRLHSDDCHHRSEDFMTIEMVAGKLHQSIEWVESKCRRRSPNPIPFHNVGNHRLFLLSEVHAWVMNSPKVIHSRHRRRTKTEVVTAINPKRKVA